MNLTTDIYPFQPISKRDKLESWVLIFAVYLIPFFQYTGLLPAAVSLVGTNVVSLFLLISLWLGRIAKRPTSVGNKILGYSVIILFFYVLYILLRSCEQYGPYEAIVVFRRNFVGALSLFFGVSYIQKFKPCCLPYVVHWIVILCIVQSVLYIGHAMGFLHLYSGLETTMTEGGVSVNRTYAGIPKCSDLVICLLLWSYIVYPRSKKLLMVGILFIAVVMTYTRSILASTVIMVVSFVLLLVMKRIIRIGRISKMLMSVLLGFCVLCVVMPDSLDFWVSRFGSTQTELKNDVGTYDFRQKLVDYSIEEIGYKDRSLTGLGYVHEAAKGEYSIVLGGDTYVAPVIYCEGFLGLLLRVLVFVPLAIVVLKRWLYSKDKTTIATSSLVLAAIAVNIIAYMQTTYFTEYQTSLILLLILFNWGISKNQNCKS